MKAGFAKQEITPEIGLPMAGFDRRKLAAEGVLDTLEVCVLALEATDGSRLAVCVFDLLGVDDALCRKVKTAVGAACGLAPQRVWVSATHTHSAPRACFAGSGDAAYTELLARRAAQAAQCALQSLVPVQAAAARTAVTGVTSLRNRGRAGAQFSMPLPLVRLQGAADTLYLARMACHPTVLDEKNLLYSADLAGSVRRRLGENALVFNGACGDLSTRFTRQASTPQELARLAGLAVQAAAQVSYGSLPDFGTHIAAAEAFAELPCAAAFDERQRQSLTDALRKKLAECTDPQAAREYDSRLAVLERPPVRREKTRTVRVCAADPGPFVLVGVPFEVDHADGLAMEQALAHQAKKPVYLVCYTGGYESYLPSGAPLTAESSYEDIAAAFLPEARPLLLTAARECVRQCTEENG